MVTVFKRGIPEFEDDFGNRYGMLCETKEDCITDDKGINLKNKFKKVQEAIDSVTTEINDTINTEIDKKVGDLSTLSTTNKNTVVDSINEVGQKFSEYSEDMQEVQEVISGINEKIENVFNTNILINPNFATNQRGETQRILDGTSAKNAKYYVDRWQAYSNTSVTKGKFTQVSGGGIRMELTDNVGQNIAIRQYFEDDYFNQFRGKKLTLSICVSDILIHRSGNNSVANAFLWGVADGSAKQVNGQLSINKAGIFTKIFSVPDKEWSKVGLYIYGADYRYGSVAGDFMTIDWIKLEPGSVATPFVPPEPGAELIKCQRYYREIVGYQHVTQWSGKMLVAYGISYEGMRAIPTCKFKDVGHKETQTGGGYYIVNNLGVMQTGFTFSISTNDAFKKVRVDATKTNHGLNSNTAALSLAGSGALCLDAEIY